MTKVDARALASSQNGNCIRFHLFNFRRRVTDAAQRSSRFSKHRSLMSCNERTDSEEVTNVLPSSCHVRRGSDGTLQTSARERRYAEETCHRHRIALPQVNTTTERPTLVDLVDFLIGAISFRPDSIDQIESHATMMTDGCERFTAGGMFGLGGQYLYYCIWPLLCLFVDDGQVTPNR